VQRCRSSDNSVCFYDSQIFEVVDRIEDEIEAHGYEELVPLEIKLALEDKVFGWTHLSSDILGHVFFTVGAYLCSYIVATEIQLQFHPFSSDRIFSWTRLLLSLWAAVSTFRMVRRRKKVWFRAAYGSKAYKQDEVRRRASVAETDRSTMLGRIRKGRDAFFARSVERKLRHAEARFERRSARRRLLAKKLPVELSPNSVVDTDSGDSSDDQSTRKGRPSFQTFPTNAIESIGHDQVLFSSGPIQKMPYAHGGFFAAAPFMLANPHWIDILRHLMPDVYVEISRRVVHAPASRLIHWAENNPVVAAYGTAHELEYNGRVPNLEWDVFLDPHLVERVDLVLQEKEKFLKGCPSGSNRKLTTEQMNIIRYYDKQLEQRVQTMVDQMLIAHGNLTQLVWEQTGYAKKYNFSRVKRTRRTLGGGIFAQQWLAVYAESLRLGMTMGHASDTATVQTKQATESSELRPALSEICPEKDESNSEKVSERIPSVLSCPSLVGSKRLTNKSNKGALGTTKNGSASAYTSLHALGSSKCPNTTMAQSVDILRKISCCSEPIGLVFDLKSRHVSPQIWALVVEAMRKAGIRIEGIASFTEEDIRDISRYTTTPVKQIIFFHSAGDMQRACHSGRIREGDTIFFNGGSLLWEAPIVDSSYIYEKLCGSFDPYAAMKKYRILPFGSIDMMNSNAVNTSTIQAYQRKFNLSIGIYCQEFCIDDSATCLLVRLVNDNPNVYNLGFCWGGVNGITVRTIQPGRFTRTDGFWNQRHIGAFWDGTLTPAEL
jgi:hypothetical protein